MDKKTMLKIFGGAFLRSLIVLMAVTIIGFGAFFLIKVNSDKKSDLVDDTGVRIRNIHRMNLLQWWQKIMQPQRI